MNLPIDDINRVRTPEAASSYLLPRLIGRQNAAWLLMSPAWISAEEVKEIGLVWRICAPGELLAEVRGHAEVFASKPISSLTAVKQTMMAPIRSDIVAAVEREKALFVELVGAAPTRTRSPRSPTASRRKLRARSRSRCPRTPRSHRRSGARLLCAPGSR